MRYVKSQFLMSPKQSSLIFTMPRYCNTLPIRLLRKLRHILRGGFLLAYH